MLKDVTLGQFFPGQTPIHRLDPRTKLVLVIVYIVALFLAKWFVSYAVIAAFLALVIAMSKIRLKVVLKNLKPLLFIIILTALLNLFYGQGEPIAQFWIFKITSSGIQNAVFMVLRISLLVTADNVGRAVPIIADDILVNFDSQRRAGAAKALAQLACHRQVILLTCHEEIVETMRVADPGLTEVVL